MTPAASIAAPAHRMGWFARTEAWLDSKGRGAWIAAMVLGFVAFWPVGLAILFYMIWSKQMFKNSCSTRSVRHARHAFKSSGNSAFDAYKAETLQRLEDEQQSFEAFLQRLREAKDKSEFDQFMDERARKARDSRPDDRGAEDDTAGGRDRDPV